MTQTTSHAAALVAAHERRLPTLDPLLPTTHPLPEPEPTDHPVRVAEGVGLVRRERPDPDSFIATWGAADRSRFIPRVGGADPAAAMVALLAQCREHVRSQVDPRDPDTEVSLTWPSRDAAMTRVFLAHRLVPATVLAARLNGRPSPEPATGAHIRPIASTDVDAAVELWMEEVRWDAQFGAATERPSTIDAVRHELAGIVARDRAWAWIAEAAGRPQGLLVVNPPQDADWVASMTSLSPVGYISCLVVARGHRGTGIGAALVRQAHAALDTAGVAVTLLHYAALNPLSVPFWHRSGYRPLWTNWHARPASMLS